jgi:hypothetical protein
MLKKQRDKNSNVKNDTLNNKMKTDQGTEIEIETPDREKPKMGH